MGLQSVQQDSTAKHRAGVPQTMCLSRAVMRYSIYFQTLVLCLEKVNPQYMFVVERKNKEMHEIKRKNT